MTTELITGFADTPHIDAADDGALNAAILGNDNYVVQGGNQFAAVMRDANHITISTGEAVMGGRHVRVTSAEDVTITSGSQGLKRHDIVGFRYSRNSSTSVETAVLDVIRGTASSTPADPALPSGNILTGASSAFMPLYRIPLDGITVGTPVPLFNVLRPMSELWDSVTQSVKTYCGTKTVNLGTDDHGYALLSAAETKSLLGHAPNTHTTLVQAMITDVSGAYVLGTYLAGDGAVSILYRSYSKATYRVTYMFTEWAE